MHPSRPCAPARVLTLAGLLLLAGACTGPRRDEADVVAENILQLGDAVSALQQENATMQEQIDSLRLALARQDTAVRQIANLAGIPLPGR